MQILWNTKYLDCKKYGQQWFLGESWKHIVLCFFNLYFYFIYLKGRDAHIDSWDIETWGETGLLSTYSFSKLQQQPRLDQPEGRNWGLPCGWQGPYYLSHHLLPPPSMPISRELALGSSPGLQPSCSDDVGCRHPKQCLIC